MGRRGSVLQALNDSIGIADVVASRMGASNSVELQIKDNDDDGAAASGEWCEWWGDPGLSTLPKPGAQALYVDLNGERIVIAVKERRWQKKLADGECVVRAQGSAAASKVLLAPDGTVTVYGTSILLGGDTPSGAVPLAELIATVVNKLVIGHGHASFGAPGKFIAPVVPMTPADISSASVKAT